MQPVDVHETKVEILPPPSENDAESLEGEEKGPCPLAESERSSIDELEVDRPSAVTSAENPAFLHEEDETKEGIYGRYILYL